MSIDRRASRRMNQKIIDRLRQPSTKRGIIALLGACGWAVTPEQGEAIIAGALFVMGLIGMFTDDKPSG